MATAAASCSSFQTFSCFNKHRLPHDSAIARLPASSFCLRLRGAASITAIRSEVFAKANAKQLPAIPPPTIMMSYLACIRLRHQRFNIGYLFWHSVS